jgi:hypothetical protein
MGVNTEFSEIWFFYPSIEDGTGEISRYVIYNYEENHWSVGNLVRYAWLDAGIEDLPFATATTSSQQCVFEHETGFDDYQDAMTGVFIESADLDIGSGDSFTFVKPDMKFVTETGINVNPAMNIVLKGRDYPGQSLTTDSTTQVTPTSTFGNVRTRARQVAFRFESDDDNAAADQKGYKWRLGSTRIEIQPSGRRG